MLSVQNEVHNVRRIPRSVELEKTFTDAILLETFKVTAVEAAKLGLLVCDILNQVELAPSVILQRHVVL